MSKQLHPPVTSMAVLLDISRKGADSIKLPRAHWLQIFSYVHAAALL